MATPAALLASQVHDLYAREAGLMHSEVRDRLESAIHDSHRGTGKYAYYLNHSGDGDSGDVVYQCNGDTMSCPYTTGTVGGKQVTNLDTDSAQKVQPHVEYLPVADDDDHYAAMESGKFYVGMDAAKLRETIPLYERFISKAERDAADEGSFAGKGKSYPILKSGDVKPAVHAMGRAGSGNYGMAQLKANIIRIAKSKGWTNELPKEWQAEHAASKEALAETDADCVEFRESASPAVVRSTKEAIAATKKAKDAKDSADTAKTKDGYKSAGDAHQRAASAHFEAAALAYKDGYPELGRKHVTKAIKHQAEASQLNENGFSQTAEGTSGLALADGEIAIRESARFAAELPLVESTARADYPIKLIDAGWGTSGYYSPKVLQKSAGIFKAGTQMFWNHATDAEEAARPEGNLDDLAAVTTSEARWDPASNALVANAKVFSDYAQKVAEKAKYTGLSIRAAGKGTMGEAEGRKGLIVEALTHAQSVDFVTRPGRGGRVLTESERGSAGTGADPAPITSQEGAAMTAQEQQEFQRLKEANQTASLQLRRLTERESIREAAGVLADYFNPAKGGIRIGEAIAQRVIGRLTMEGQCPLKQDGTLDSDKLKEAAKKEAEAEIAYLKTINPSLVVGMGTAATGTTTQVTEADQKRMKEERKEWSKHFAASMGLSPNQKMGRKILMEGRRAFDVTYNAAVHGAAVAGAGATLEG